MRLKIDCREFLAASAAATGALTTAGLVKAAAMKTTLRKSLIGNHVKYAPPQEWIRALGKTIVKCHVKDYKLNPDGHGGNWADIRDGSVDWPAVRQLLDEFGHEELWMTIEGSGKLPLDERSKRLDLIIAGK